MSHSTKTTSSPSKFRFSIDRGGTFTDVFAQCPSRTIRVCKLLSNNEECYGDAPTEGIRRIIEMDTGMKLPPESKINSTLIESIRMGTTVATNALLERKGEPTALLITKGFRDLLHIGNQARPGIFDLTVTCPSNIYSEVVEVDERVYLEKPECGLKSPQLNNPKNRIQLTNGSVVLVEKEPDLKEVEKDLNGLLQKGISSLAVVFLHSWAFDEHEMRIKKLGEELGFKHVSVSSEVMPMVRVVPRGFTTVVDSYSTPLIRDYLESFKKGFTSLHPSQVLFMQSDGGLTSMNRFCGSRAILSGPAGGVVGYARTVYDKYKEPVIGFDMGGTSTDVSRFDGEFLHSFENCTAGVVLQTAQLDIQTVAAGGGSILSFASGIYNVGPESAGANPGPVAYDHGGTLLTITDANLVLNRLVPSRFPKIFGPNHDCELNVSKTVAVFEKLRDQVNLINREYHEETSSLDHKDITLEEVAQGFILVANETMARPIRNITQGKGYDPATHMLACFGGAGGQHACAIAESLGIQVVVVPRYAGILSAVGIHLADVVVEGSEPDRKGIQSGGESLEKYICSRFELLCDSLGGKLKAEWGGGVGGDDYSELPFSLTFEKFLNMRYEGTDCSIMVKGGGNEATSMSSLQQFTDSFLQEYSRQFGFQLDRNVVIDDLRVRAVGGSGMGGDDGERGGDDGERGGNNKTGKQINYQKYDKSPLMTVKGYFQRVGVVPDCPVYECGGDGDVDSTSSNFYYMGPCIILDELSTIVVEPGWRAIMDSGSVRLESITNLNQNPHKKEGIPPLDNIVLSVFSHRFMSIAEQMGRILQRTSVSVNIKERLDFSCAIFGADGGLVSNAPHIPVHLGAMQEAVQYQLRVSSNCSCPGCTGNASGDNPTCLNLYPGDVLLSNHPIAGGSHLPDLTVITPVFHENEDKNNKNTAPIFFVANRGHHADIGGSTPGSMPPNSQSIHEEGAVFKSFKLVRGGEFMEAALIKELNKPGKVPGCSGTRNLSDNLSDLRAQVAANKKGIGLLQSLIKEYSLPYVQTYMKYIQENAELAVRDMLRSVAANSCDLQRECREILQLAASDYMDDGTEIRLTVIINVKEGTGIFDFTGTGWQVIGNCNAPKAITLSAVIYCLRCLVGRDVPLNQGCLRPIQIIIPPGSILCPAEDAAVVGGNVLTSQRVVDVILKAFNACAASQGCTNNITFGTEEMGYYETVAGGSGAGPTWHGRSGIHTHMTNTRITDPEILELRYPVILNHFSLEPGSGGHGKYRGGDGVRRELLFRRQMRLSVLTERRVFRPYGMEGGGEGARGRNLLARAWYNRDQTKEEGVVYLGGKTSVDVKAGDLFVLVTPGAGGWGREE